MDTDRKTIEWLKSCQNADGGFGNFPGAKVSMADYTVAAVASLSEFYSEMPNDRSKCIDWMKSCQNDDSAFGRVPGDTSFADYTCSALAALYTLGVYLKNVSKIIGWLKSCGNEDGGFGRRQGEPSDVDSTASCVSGLSILGEKPDDPYRIIKYIHSLRCPQGYMSSAGGKGNIEYAALALTVLEHKFLQDF